MNFNNKYSQYESPIKSNLSDKIVEHKSTEVPVLKNPLKKENNHSSFVCRFPLKIQGS